MAGDNFDLQGWMREQKQGPYTGAKGVEKVALKSSKPKSKTGLNEGLMGMIDLQPVGHLSEEFNDDDFAAGMNDEEDLDNYFNSYPEDNELGKDEYMDEGFDDYFPEDLALFVSNQEGDQISFPGVGKSVGDHIDYIYEKNGRMVKLTATIEKLRGGQGIGFNTPGGYVIIPKKFIGDDGMTITKSTPSMDEDDDIPTNDQDYTTQPGYIHEEGGNIADKWDMIPGDEKEAMLDSVDDAEEGLADYAYMGWAMVPEEVKAKIGDMVMAAKVAELEPDEDDKMAAMAMKQAKKGAKAIKGLNPEKDIHDLLYGDDEYDDDL